MQFVSQLNSFFSATSNIRLLRTCGLAMFIVALMSVHACKTIQTKQSKNKSAEEDLSSSSEHFSYKIDRTNQWELFAKEFTGSIMGINFILDTNSTAPLQEGDIKRNKLVFFDAGHYGVHQEFVHKAVYRFIGRPSEDVNKAIGYTSESTPSLEIIPGTIAYIQNLKEYSPTYTLERESFNRIGFMYRFTPQEYKSEVIKTLEQALIQINRSAYQGKIIVFKMPMNDLGFLSNDNPLIGGEPFSKNFEIINWGKVGTSGDTNVVYNQAKSFGYLKRISAADFAAGEYTNRDILIMDEVPLDIGPLSGFISTISQDLLSHTIIRAKNQNIPNAKMLKREVNLMFSNLTSFGADFSQLVYMETSIDSNDNPIIRIVPQNSPASSGLFTDESDFLAKADIYFKSRTPNLPPIEFDIAKQEMFLWREKTTAPSGKIYGAKGRNFAILDKALNDGGYNRQEYAKSFLLPFHYYHQFIGQSVNARMCEKAQKGCASEFAANANCAVAKSLCLESTTIANFIAKVIDRPSGNYSALLGDASKRKAYLAFVREMIKEGDFDSLAKSEILGKLNTSFNANTRIRFRSSTNAEDLPGLTGAGLYSSHGGCIADENAEKTIPLPAFEETYFSPRGCTKSRYDALVAEVVLPNAESLNLIKNTTTGVYQFNKGSHCATDTETKRNLALACRVYQNSLDSVQKATSLEIVDDLSKKRPVFKALRKVFSSVWYEKAFLNRDYYGIDHVGVKMGVLVHPSFADERANGVLIVSDLPNGEVKVQVSAQVEDISITNPMLKGVKSDVFYVTRSSSGQLSAAVYQSKSTDALVNNLPDGTVLSKEQIIDLAKQAILVHEKLRQILTTQFTGQTDIEWKLTPNGSGTGEDIITIKQMRPY